MTGTEAKYQSDAGSTKDTPYLTLTGELWGVFWEYLWEKWLRYNGTALYAGCYHKEYDEDINWQKNSFDLYHESSRLYHGTKNNNMLGSTHFCTNNVHHGTREASAYC